MIKGILFDYDGTLSCRYESAYHMYQFLLGRISKGNLKGLEMETRVQRCMMWDQFGTVNKKYVIENIRESWYPDIDVDYWKNYWYASFDQFQIPMPGSREVLKDLKNKYQLGVLSNGDSASQHAKITRLGLDDLFDEVIVSGDYGIQKPDVRIFEKAAGLMNLKCQEIAMIGDTYFTDIIGAIHAGMMPVWYCYEKRCATDTDVTIAENFDDIRKLFL